MRRRLLSEGAKELSYEIREIVKKANQLKALGLPIHWENIGDPIEKKCQVPDWIKDIVVDLVRTNRSYGYCPSKGMLETREFLVKENNKLGGAQINVDDICKEFGCSKSTVNVIMRTAEKKIIEHYMEPFQMKDVHD